MFRFLIVTYLSYAFQNHNKYVKENNFAEYTLNLKYRALYEVNQKQTAIWFVLLKYYKDFKAFRSNYKFIQIEKYNYEIFSSTFKIS